jgi:hypothetical protein
MGSYKILFTAFIVLLSHDLLLLEWRTPSRTVKCKRKKKSFGQGWLEQNCIIELSLMYDIN